jgi:hypothetical protein
MKRLKSMACLTLYTDLLLVQKVNFRKERNRVNEKAKQGSKEVNIARKDESKFMGRYIKMGQTETDDVDRQGPDESAKKRHQKQRRNV